MVRRPSVYLTYLSFFLTVIDCIIGVVWFQICFSFFLSCIFFVNKISSMYPGTWICEQEKKVVWLHKKNENNYERGTNYHWDYINIIKISACLSYFFLKMKYRHSWNSCASIRKKVEALLMIYSYNIHEMIFFHKRKKEIYVFNIYVIRYRDASHKGKSIFLRMLTKWLASKERLKSLFISSKEYRVYMESR